MKLLDAYLQFRDPWVLPNAIQRSPDRLARPARMTVACQKRTLASLQGNGRPWSTAASTVGSALYRLSSESRPIASARRMRVADACRIALDAVSQIADQEKDRP